MDNHITVVTVREQQQTYVRPTHFSRPFSMPIGLSHKKLPETVDFRWATPVTVSKSPLFSLLRTLSLVQTSSITQITMSSPTSSGCPPFSGPVVGLSHYIFGVPLLSQNSPFLQVHLSSIAFPTNLLARLRRYLTIASVGMSLMKFSLGSVRQIKLALLAIGQRFSTFFILWTPQTFQARVADPHSPRRPGLNVSYLRLGQNMSHWVCGCNLLKFC